MTFLRGAVSCFVVVSLAGALVAPAAGADGEDDSADAARLEPRSPSPALVDRASRTSARIERVSPNVARIERAPNAAQALVASAVYPGLGQLLNGTEAKAVAVGGIGAFLAARLVLEDRRTRNSYRRYQETGEGRYFDEYSDHFDRRQTLVWWVVVAAIYGLADAYVDAHLADFDEPSSPSLEGSRSGAGAHDDPGLRIGVAIRF